jgi:phage I-like protein
VFKTNQAAMGRDTIPLDYEHNTVPKTTEYERTSEPRPVAAHLSCDVVEGDGVYCNVLDWTESGQKNAKNYKDLSPAPYVDGDGTLLGMHSVALTQTGAVIDLTFMASDCQPEFDADLMALSASIPGSQKLLPKSAMQHMNVFRKFMGMDGASDEEVLRCMSAEMESGKMCRTGPLDNAAGSKPSVNKPLGSGEAKSMIKAEVDEALKPMTAALTALSAERTSEKKAADKAARQVQIDRATREGKVIPLSAEQIAGLDVLTLTALVDGLPKTINFKRNGEPIVDPKANGKIKTDGKKILVLNADNTVTLGDAPTRQLPGSGLNRTRAAFDEQIAALRR